MNLYAADAASLARSRKMAVERFFNEYEPLYWKFKLEQLDSFWDKPARERYAWYLSKEPVIPFFAALSDLGKMAGEQVKRMATDYASLQKEYGDG